jgi:hypothetical protein
MNNPLSLSLSPAAFPMRRDGTESTARRFCAEPPRRVPASLTPVVAIQLTRREHIHVIIPAFMWSRTTFLQPFAAILAS